MTFLLELQYEIEAESFEEARALIRPINYESKYVRKNHESLGIIDESVFPLPPEQE